ncbi:hypothetical protein TNCV_3436391 [Trichonephila clavipes]|nr:hypothetical protein TNCV_3436391 [Trichonephila clavipes]
MIEYPVEPTQCTMQHDWALIQSSSVCCIETYRSVFTVTVTLVHSHFWGDQLTVPNEPIHARLETNLRFGQVNEG